MAPSVYFDPSAPIMEFLATLGESIEKANLNDDNKDQHTPRDGARDPFDDGEDWDHGDGEDWDRRGHRGGPPPPPDHDHKNHRGGPPPPHGPPPPPNEHEGPPGPPPPPHGPHGPHGRHGHHDRRGGHHHGGRGGPDFGGRGGWGSWGGRGGGRQWGGRGGPWAAAAAAAAEAGAPWFGPWGPRHHGRCHNKDSSSDELRPAVDVFDTVSHYTVHVALPGALKEDIGIHFDDDKSELQISGVVHRPGDEEFLKTMVSSERVIGAFDRTVKLGKEGETVQVEADEITAKLENGVLEVVVPKKEKVPEVERRKIEIL